MTKCDGWIWASHCWIRCDCAECSKIDKKLEQLQNITYAQFARAKAKRKAKQT